MPPWTQKDLTIRVAVSPLQRPERQASMWLLPETFPPKSGDDERSRARSTSFVLIDVVTVVVCLVSGCGRKEGRREGVRKSRLKTSSNRIHPLTDRSNEAFPSVFGPSYTVRLLGCFISSYCIISTLQSLDVLTDRPTDRPSVSLSVCLSVLGRRMEELCRGRVIESHVFSPASVVQSMSTNCTVEMGWGGCAQSRRVSHVVRERRER